jgi:hypothetical protein
LQSPQSSQVSTAAFAAFPIRRLDPSYKKFEFALAQGIRKDIFDKFAVPQGGM